MLQSLSLSCFLPPIDLTKRLIKYNQGVFVAAGSFSLLRLLLRYNTHLGASLGAQLLLDVFPTQYPLDKELCQQLCAQLAQLPSDVIGYPEYNLILRNERSREFMDDDQRKNSSPRAPFEDSDKPWRPETGNT